MTAPTTQHRQQLAAAKLAHLLTLPAPECVVWRIELGEHGAEIHGQVRPYGAVVSYLQLHQWAAVLDDVTWQLKTYQETPKGELRITGTYQGVRVLIWDGLEDVADLDLAEVSAPPEVDEIPECTGEMIDSRWYTCGYDGCDTCAGYLPDPDRSDPPAPGRYPEMMIGSDL